MRYDALFSIFRTVESDSRNRTVFGHRIRDLLMACCTEIETAWRGVLKANAYSPVDRNDNLIIAEKWTTTYFIKLRDVLHIKDYSVSFFDFPQLGVIKPFKNR